MSTDQHAELELSREILEGFHHLLSCATHSFVTYGVATVSRIDKIIGLFCRISSLL